MPSRLRADSLASQRLARANEEKIQRLAMQVRVQESVDDLTSAACGIYITCEQANYIVSLYVALPACAAGHRHSLRGVCGGWLVGTPTGSKALR